MRDNRAVTDGPLIVQSDKTLLLEIDHALSEECRHAIAPFAELERAPEHVHTYRITPLALWNARAAGHDAEQVVDVLLRYSRYPVPHSLLVDIAETMSRAAGPQIPRVVIVEVRSETCAEPSSGHWSRNHLRSPMP